MIIANTTFIVPSTTPAIVSVDHGKQIADKHGWGEFEKTVNGIFIKNNDIISVENKIIVK